MRAFLNVLRNTTIWYWIVLLVACFAVAYIFAEVVRLQEQATAREARVFVLEEAIQNGALPPWLTVEVGERTLICERVAQDLLRCEWQEGNNE